MSSRWSDHDRNWGPFTYAPDDYSRLGFVIDLGGPYLRIHLFSRTLLLRLPQRFHRGREYGFIYAHVEKCLHLRYGKQAYFSDSGDSGSRCWSIPWLNKRFVRLSIYGLSGEHFATEPKPSNYNVWTKAIDRCPKVDVEFTDFDGERITATTHIEEREWHHGTGWFKWMSAFVSPMIRRSLDIRFSAEVGKRKGSWKGGTIGHGIDMAPGELHESAFRRYCVEHSLTMTCQIPAGESQEVKP